MATLYLFNTEQSARLGDRRSDFSRVNGLGLEAIFTDLLNTNGEGTFLLTSQFNNNQKNGLVYNIPTLCGLGDCSLKPSSWTYGMKNCLGFGSLTSADITWWNNNIAGHELSIKLLTKTTNVVQQVTGGGSNNPYWVIYDFYISSAPSIINGSEVIVSENCLLDNDYWSYYDICSKTFSTAVFNSEVRYKVELVVEEEDCIDNRTSESTQGVYITANWEDPLGNQLSEDYNLLFQPDSQTTQGSLSFTNQYQYMMGLKGVTCRFNRGVVRDTGYIKINGHIDAEIYKVDMLGNTLVPVFEDITENFIIQFSFEPCCDYPAVVSETYTDAVESLKEQGANLMMGKVVFDSVEWHGFALLEDYCCDDVTCDDDVKMESSEEPIYIGVGGGGENVDITCICDNLSLINDTLSAKFTALNGKMDSLIETIEDKDLTVSFDDCVCDNLGLIKDSIDDVVSEIHDKDMSPIVNNTIQPPVNNITVEPCSPVVTNPVNNITVPIPSVTVSPPVNNVTVEPCSPVVTNPVNNITVPVPTVNVAGDTVNVNTDLSDLIDELHNDLVTEDSQGNDIGIAKIIKNKDMGSDIEVSITPNELLNYRKVIRDSLDEI